MSLDLSKWRVRLIYLGCMIPFAGLVITDWFGFSSVWQRAAGSAYGFALGGMFLLMTLEGLTLRRIPFLGDDWEPHEPLFRWIVGLYVLLASLFFWLGGYFLMNALSQ